jgi:hypothetical protein
MGRADDDEVSRASKSFLYARCQIGRSAKLIPVAEGRDFPAREVEAVAE